MHGTKAWCGLSPVTVTAPSVQASGRPPRPCTPPSLGPAGPALSPVSTPGVHFPHLPFPLKLPPHPQLLSCVGSVSKSCPCPASCLSQWLGPSLVHPPHEPTYAQTDVLELGSSSHSGPLHTWRPGSWPEPSLGSPAPSSCCHKRETQPREERPASAQSAGWLCLSALGSLLPEGGEIPPAQHSVLPCGAGGQCGVSRVDSEPGQKLSRALQAPP